MVGNYQDYDLLDQKYHGEDAVTVLYAGTRNFSCYDQQGRDKDLSYLRPYTKAGTKFDPAMIRQYLEANGCEYIQEYIKDQLLFRNYKFVMKVPVVVLLNAGSVRAYMYHTVPAFYESNTTKPLTYSLLEEPEKKFSFIKRIKQFMDDADLTYVQALTEALRQAGEAAVAAFYPQLLNVSKELPPADAGTPFQLFTMEVILDREVVGHVRDFYPSTEVDKDFLADVLNLAGLRYAPVGDDGKNIKGG